MPTPSPMRIGLVLGGLLMIPQAARAVAPTPDETADARRFTAARFEAAGAPAQVEPGLLVLANHDPVTLNGRGSKPLKVADKEYTRGLYCHAVSKVVVRLPAPGKTFSAVVGVDSNDQTRPGRGSIVFRVVIGDKEAFRSDVLHEGMAAVPVTVDLAGAREFTLEVGDAGDGISCDQAAWADAQVACADGSAVWLGDLKILEGPGDLFAPGPPFSFTCGGRSSAEFLKTWTLQRQVRKLDDHRTEHTLTYTDPASGLVLRCVAVAYDDFPTVEWTLHFKNTGAADSAILEDIQALDLAWHRGEGGEFLLHHGAGSQAGPQDYRPLETPLGPNARKRIAAAGGRPTNSDLSYFNLEWGGRGLIVVVGWPGQWAAEFACGPGRN